jgi:hypothetical protein
MASEPMRKILLLSATIRNRLFVRRGPTRNSNATGLPPTGGSDRKGVSETGLSEPMGDSPHLTNGSFPDRSVGRNPNIRGRLGA